MVMGQPTPALIMRMIIIIAQLCDIVSGTYRWRPRKLVVTDAITAEPRLVRQARRAALGLARTRRQFGNPGRSPLRSDWNAVVSAYFAAATTNSETCFTNSTLTFLPTLTLSKIRLSLTAKFMVIAGQLRLLTA